MIEYQSIKSKFHKFGLKLLNVLEYVATNIIHKYVSISRTCIIDIYGKALHDFTFEGYMAKNYCLREVIGCS